MTELAHAAAPAAGGAGGFASFIPLILIFVVFYFLLIRPQQKQAKKHQAFLNDLKKGNKVVTKGGIHGQIVSLSDNVVTLEIAKDITIKVSRDAIGGPLGKDGTTEQKEIKSSGG
ncbi:preprotein translocase subunit YajC [Desulforhopalus singaporensis]|uniref:Sec translocon accessory complex subunit YajC n=1 Tax=Desulforhopalus singaporensis TaxID=91360 RepID=A0A1H0QC55_9BACT|nr:preprotein translocase subunit YajC [Desulforhopalus singaporensis]SDP14268.1 protein translocase subunit yajC [Desulforhopalus singaporensis]